MEKNLVFFFQTPSGKTYAYVGLSNEILRMTGIDDGAELTSALTEKMYESLKKNGYIRGTAFQAVRWKRSFEECIRVNACMIPHLILEVTQHCNLRCTYCTVSGAACDAPRQADMSLETMLQSIDFFAEHNREYPSASISFFGGEALLRFDEIRRAVAYAEERIQDKPLDFNISTNGVLLTAEVANWLAEHPSVLLTCTINGPYHDFYRLTPNGEGSLEQILRNLTCVRMNYPKVWKEQIRFLANVDKESDIFDMLDFYKKEFNRPPQIITMIDWNGHTPNRAISNTTYADILRQIDFSREDMIRDYYKNTLIFLRKRGVDRNATTACIGSCFPCTANLFVRADKTLGYCERVSNQMIIGNLETGFDETRLRDAYEKIQLLFAKTCKTCWAQRLCQLCLAGIVDNDGKIIDCIPEITCSAQKKNVENHLVLYCKLLEENPDLVQTISLKQ